MRGDSSKNPWLHLHCTFFPFTSIIYMLLNWISETENTIKWPEKTPRLSNFKSGFRFFSIYTNRSVLKEIVLLVKFLKWKNGDFVWRYRMCVYLYTLKQVLLSNDSLLKTILLSKKLLLNIFLQIWNNYMYLNQCK